VGPARGDGWATAVARGSEEVIGEARMRPMASAYQVQPTKGELASFDHLFGAGEQDHGLCRQK
jgi:hypothetical protein